MVKREELKLEITAKDDASGKIDEVAAKLEGLSGSATVEITATDEATEVVEEVTEGVENLDGESAEVELAAEDEATEIVEELTEGVEDLDGTAAEVALDAADNASGDIETVSGGLADLDGESAATTIDLDDGGAADDIEDVSGALSDLDSESASPTIDVEGAEAGAEATGSMVGDLGAMAAGGALATGAVAGLLAIGSTASDAVLQVKGIADATGGSLDDTSRLLEVWDLVGGSADTLERNIIRANDRLRESPELAAELGIKIDDNMSPMQVFIEAVNALNSGQLTANERLDLAMEIFGSKGVLMLNDLQTIVGDLDQGMADIGENEIITQEDVDQALAFKEQWDAVEDKIAEIGRRSLPLVNTALTGLVSLMDGSVVDAFQNMWDNVPDWLFGGDPVEPEVRPTFTLPAEFETWDEFFATLPDGAQFLNDVEGATDGVTGAMGDADAAIEEANDAIDEQVGALEDEQAALEASIELLEDYVDAQRDSYDTEVGLREAKEKSTAAVDDYVEANQAYIDSLNAAEPVIADQEEAERNRNDAGQDVIASLVDEADAYVDMSQAAIEASGGVYTAQQGVDDFNASLANTASTIPNELIPQFVDMAMSINDIPTEHRSIVEAAVGSGDPERIENTLKFLSRTRDAAIRAESNKATLAQVERELEALRSKTRTAYIGATGPGTRYGDYRTGNRPMATGTSYANRGLTLVGEEGPELVDMPMGARVTNAGQTDEWMRNGGGSQPTSISYITNNFPAGVRSRDTRRAERRYDRTQAS